MSTEQPIPQAPVEQSIDNTPQFQSELRAFNTHVEANQVPVPANYKTSGDWFKSLKNAQSEFTKAKQELAEYRKQQPTSVSPTPVEVEETEAPEETMTDDTSESQEELRIQPASLEETPATVVASQLTQDEWKKYSVEVAVKGDLSPESRAAIKQRTNIPDFMLDEFMQGQKARLTAAYGEAAKVVGGREQLAKVFEWASNNMTPQQQGEINATLASPSWEVALLGLKAKFDQAKPRQPTFKEPNSPVGKAIPLAKSQVSTGAYTSKAEFYADRNNPLFKTDNRFRTTTEARMSRTDFNKLN